MITKKTILVVGAGGSFEIGLPIGKDLKHQIAKKLDYILDRDRNLSYGQGDKGIYNYLLNRGGDYINYFRACIQIRNGIELPASIDDYIDNHQHDTTIADCAKLAIARSILDAERDSAIAMENNREFSKGYGHQPQPNQILDMGRVRDTWYPAFYQLLTQGLSKDNLSHIFDNLTIISFNYDRCIEHYLYHALKQHYGLQDDEVETILSKLYIYRPYGSVGPYLGSNRITYGQEHIPDLGAVTKTLQTYTEQVRNHKELKAIHDAIADSNVMIFLGMAFHQNNMKLLIGGDATRNMTSKTIFATRHGISEEDMPHVKQSLFRVSQNRGPQNYDSMNFSMTCANLFDQHRMSLRVAC